MSKVDTFEVTIENPSSVANSILNGLKDGWEVDSISQSNHNSLGNNSTNADYFFFKNLFSSKNFSLCLCCPENTIIPTAIRNIDNESATWSKEDYEKVVKDFAKTFFSKANITWKKERFTEP